MWVVCEEPPFPAATPPPTAVHHWLSAHPHSLSLSSGFAGCAAHRQLITLSSWSSTERPLGFTLTPVKTALTGPVSYWLRGLTSAFELGLSWTWSLVPEMKCL